MSAVTSPSDLVDSFARREPDWLSALRREGWARHGAIEYPSGNEEVWRYTDVSLLRPEGFGVLSPDVAASVETIPAKAALALQLSGTASGGLAVHADGSPIQMDLSEEARRLGVVYTDLARAVDEHADLLRPRLGALVAPDDPFRSLSLALHRGGTFLYVPKGVQLRAPVQALHWISAEGALVAPRSVIIVEEGARIVFNDLYSSDALGRPTLALPVTEMFLGPGAEVGWVTWQDWGPGVRHLANVKAHLDRDAKLNTLLVTLGGDYSRTWKECVLAGAGSESIMFGLYFSHRDQRFEHWTLQDHAAPNTRSDLLYKGVLSDTSRCVYYGTIKVRRNAQKTDAYQANRNLTLSPKAKADTNPQLEIETNDVRCTHGATVGRVDANHVFYLMSRGISRPEAERLIVFGFFNEVLGRVEWSGMHQRLGEAIHEKLELSAKATEAGT